MKRLSTIGLAIMAILLTSLPARAVNTRIVIRAKAHGAKFIGSAVGGMAVTVTDAESGDVLSKGHIQGGTGDTDLIVKGPRKPGEPIAKGAASFTAQLNIERATRVTIEAQGPLAAGPAATKVSKTIWVLPGQHVEGDDVVLEVPGAIVHPIAPLPNEKVVIGEPMQIEAWVTLMCGCHIKKDGPWKPDAFDVAASVLNGKGERVETVVLSHSGQASRFTGTFIPTAPGSYKIVIGAGDRSGNRGVGVTGFGAEEE